MTARRLALALALLAGCKRGCDREAAPPPSQNPIPTALFDAPSAPEDLVALDLDPPWDGAVGSTRDEAVFDALGGAHDATRTVFRELDADGDGRQDALIETRRGCVLARRTRTGWIADAFALDAVNTPGHCAAPTLLTDGTLLAASLFSNELDDSPQAPPLDAQLGLFIALPSQPLRRVFESRTHGDDTGDWTYEPNPDGTLTVLNHAQRTLAGDASTAIVGYMLLRWNTLHTALEQASCWQSIRPIAPRDAIPGCTARPALPVAHHPLDAPSRDAPTLPAHTLLRIVNADSLTRANARLYCVLAPDGTYGHSLLADAELTGCPVPIP